MSTVQVSQSDDIVTIMLAGEFDAANVDEVQVPAQQALARAGVAAIIIDLGQVTFMGSTGLGALVGLHGDAHRRSINLALRAVPPRVQRLLNLTGLDTLFRIENGGTPDTGDREDAGRRPAR